MPRLQKRLQGGARKTSAANDPVVLRAAEPNQPDYAGLRRLRYGYAQHLRDGLLNATFVAFTRHARFAGRPTPAPCSATTCTSTTSSRPCGTAPRCPSTTRAASPGLELKGGRRAAAGREVDGADRGRRGRRRQGRAAAPLGRAGKTGGAPPPRIQKVAATWWSTSRTASASLDGKAMVVAMSRDICVHLYDAIVALRPAGTTR